MKVIYLIVVLLILVFSIFSINAIMNTNNWHDVSKVLITVDSYTMTLEEAVTNNIFVEGATSSGTTVIPNPGHDFDEIWISIDGDEKTLQDALSISNNICGSFETTSYLSTPSSLVYHFANEIEISSGTSLQDAIDDGDFCCVLETCASLGYNCGTANDGCEGTLSCGTCYPYLCQNNICSSTCGTCKIYSPPAPSWCSDGRIVGSFPDACGCVGPPICCQIPLSCRMYSPPHPDWCSDGTILPGIIDECGCQGHPRCII